MTILFPTLEEIEETKVQYCFLIIRTCVCICIYIYDMVTDILKGLKEEQHREHEEPEKQFSYEIKNIKYQKEQKQRERLKVGRF